MSHLASPEIAHLSLYPYVHKQVPKNVQLFPTLGITNLIHILSLYHQF